MDCYPAAVQEYLAAFAPHEVPRIVNRLLLWAVRYQLALAAESGNTTSLAPPRLETTHGAGISSSAKRSHSVVRPPKQRVSEEPQLAKPDNLFGKYPSWWGHEEHKPSPSPRQLSRTLLSKNQATGETKEWTTRKKTVDEATQTLGPAAFVCPPRPKQAKNEAWTQVSRFFDVPDSGIPADGSERRSTPQPTEDQGRSRDYGEGPPRKAKQRSQGGPGVLRRRPQKLGSPSRTAQAEPLGPAAIVAAFLASSFVQCLDEAEDTENSDLSSNV